MLKLLKKWLGQNGKTAPTARKKSNRFRPNLEGLEERAVPAAYEWVGTGAYWNQAADWKVWQLTGGSYSWVAQSTNYPGAGDSAQFDSNSGSCYLQANYQVAQLKILPSFASEVCTMGGDFQSTLTVGVADGGTAPAASFMAGGEFANNGNLVIVNTNFNWTGGNIDWDVEQSYGNDNLGTIWIGGTIANTGNFNLANYSRGLTSTNPETLQSNVVIGIGDAGSAYGQMTLGAGQSSPWTKGLGTYDYAMSNNVTIAGGMTITIDSAGKLRFGSGDLGAGLYGGLQYVGGASSASEIINSGTIIDSASDSTGTDYLREDAYIDNYGTVELWRNTNAMMVAGNGPSVTNSFINESGSTLHLNPGSTLEASNNFLQNGGTTKLTSYSSAISTYNGVGIITSLDGNVTFDGGSFISASTNLALVANSGSIGVSGTDFTFVYSGYGANIMGAMSFTTSDGTSTWGSGNSITLSDPQSPGLATPPSTQTYNVIVCPDSPFSGTIGGVTISSANFGGWSVNWNGSSPYLTFTATV